MKGPRVSVCALVALTLTFGGTPRAAAAGVRIGLHHGGYNSSYRHAYGGYSGYGYRGYAHYGHRHHGYGRYYAPYYGYRGGHRSHGGHTPGAPTAHGYTLSPPPLREVDPEINGKPLLPHAEPRRDDASSIVRSSPSAEPVRAASRVARSSSAESRATHAPAGQAGEYPEPGSDYPMGESSAAASDGAGWALLSSDPTAALAAFAAEANANPELGLPKAGYALANALLADHERAVWAMRRAVAFEADALHYAPVSPAEKTQIKALHGVYRERAASPTGTSDDRFMAAALGFIIHDYASAGHDTHAAIASGDEQETTKRLAELIARHEGGTAAQ